MAALDPIGSHFSRHCRGAACAATVLFVLAAAAEPPVAYWRLHKAGRAGFANESALGGVLDAVAEGAVTPARPGPPARWFPFLQADTRAVGLGAGPEAGAIVVPDPGADSVLDVGPGESVTLEAWVNAASASESGVVLLGKGRLEEGEPALNYGLGLRSHLNLLWPSFVFTAADASAETGPVRWAATNGFARDSGWHHVAVSFTFGRPDSLAFHLDGVRQPGGWTEETAGRAGSPPAVNDRPLRLAGSARNAIFRGAIAEVKLHRRLLSEAEIRGRLDVPPAPVAARAIDPGEVQVELRAGGPFSHGWIFDTASSPVLRRYVETALAFYRLPQPYVSPGVRGDWPNPLLLRAATRVSLPPGRHRLLLRAHGMARLMMDGRVVAEVTYRQLDQSGHTPVEFIPEPPLPGTRALAPACRETLVEIEAAGGEHVFVLEARAGGRSGNRNAALRRELGETLAAVQLAGDRHFTLLGPGERVLLTDEAWKAFVVAQEAAYDRLDTEHRAAVRAGDDAYWRSRHTAARDHVATLPPLAIPPPGGTLPEANLIDRFLNAKIERARAAGATATGTVQFHRDVQPILDRHCLSCHGARPKGDLRLDTREAAFAGGGSGAPGVLPGRPAESEILRRILTEEEEDVMPARGDRLTAGEIGVITTWIREGAAWPDEAPAAPVVTLPASDDEFLRRVHLDVVGQIPSMEEIAAFQADSRPDRRARWIDRLLADPRWADHWVPHWQDLLAENPTLANLSANATGPFRWWIHEALRDNLPVDRFATELIGMRGSESQGGPAGFALAADNDVPMAEKAAIVSSAFLGVQMKCARCHDAPFHASTQEDLFSLAAMLQGSPLAVPASSSVPGAKLEKPNVLIKVTLPPGSKVAPRWSLDQLLPRTEASPPPGGKEAGPRDLLAAAVTSPRNLRFAQVIANRVWARYFGRGLRPALDDWEQGSPTHPELLEYLARELMSNGYDLKRLARLILNSQAYQRRAYTHEDSNRLFAAPPRRPMTAEQVVDSLVAAVGVPLETEPLNLDLYNTRDFRANQNLEAPAAPVLSRRAWQYALAPLDRDRPSLSLPRLQAVTDVLVAFGWRGARFEPIGCRETPMHPLQPATIANGNLSLWLVRLAEDSAITRLALQDQPLDRLIETVFLRILSRPPGLDERTLYRDLLGPGYARRVIEAAADRAETAPRPVLSWTNNMMPEANTLRLAEARRAREGPPPTARLDPDWRQRMEDGLWALLNAPETILVP